MKEGTARIDASMKKIASIIEDNKSGIHEVAGECGGIASAFAVLTDLSDRNSDDTSILDGEIEKFST